MKQIFFLFVIFSCYALKLDAQKTFKSIDKIISSREKLQLVSNQFAFAEGPATDKNGDVYFTDQPNDKIWKYDTKGKLSLYMNKTGRANGLYFSPDGNLIACADEHDELWSISRDKKVTVLLSYFQGKKLNGPNDLWIDKNGGIYFTDPYYQRNYWIRTKPDLQKQNVYYLPKGAKQPIIVDDDIEKPNGIVGTPDGKTLYVADIQANKTYRYNINSDGTLSGKKLIIHQGSDGMTIDNKGNLYLCGKGVTIYNKNGEKLGHISVPENWTGNICFGGKYKNILFITASHGVYIIKTKVKGVE
ncbi:gluconolactonase [Arachidicoccus ginsenosidimutans]|uniref:SMP-30/gluconolactonase/LRE family protein n=1 Tax=Arachidicoccus sp. BS20 TaxID=1850526 RepID=UPI0007F179F0|nr:SMP-30/gluconolactonase/LRE family protein [Arachidicoccus sp. BS20]ANI90094.1 gluconolactonase [Arachidicoccus sp. BS20]